MIYLLKQQNALFSMQRCHIRLNVIDSEIERESGDAFEGTEGFVNRCGQSLLGFLVFQTQMCPPSAIQLHRLLLLQKSLRPHCLPNLLNNGRII